MRTLVFAAALLCLAGPTHARQAPVGREADPGVLAVLQAQGLIGVWAVDCHRAPSADNGRETIRTEGLRVISIVEEQAVFVAEILSARRIDSRDTEMHMREREYGVNFDVVYRREGDRQMTWSSMDSDGEALITEGRLANGEMGKWYRLCSPPGSI